MKITIGILAHVDAGKTTLSEQILYRTGAVRSPGTIDRKTTLLDSHPLEKERGITIFSGQAVFQRGENTYYLIDTPGHVDFAAEMERVLEILDYAILLIDGTKGVQGHTETIWRLLKQHRIPVFLYVNKLDLASADYRGVLAGLQDCLSPAITDFSAWPAESAQLPEQLCEAMAERDDLLLESYLDGALDFAAAVPRLQIMIRERSIFPCLGGSAAAGRGVEELLRLFFGTACTEYHDGGNFRARVFKVRHTPQMERLTCLKILQGRLQVKNPVIRNSFPESEKIQQIRIYQGERYQACPEASAGDIVAVTGLHSTRAGDGLGEGSAPVSFSVTPALQAKVLFPPGVPDQKGVEIFQLLSEEEPAVTFAWESALKQLKVSLMGSIQLEVLTRLIEDRFGIAVSFGQPEVLYLETIREPVTGYGHFEPLRHYAEVALRLEPNPRGTGITFSSQCSADRLTVNYQNLIRTHVFETLHKGVMTGAGLTDVHVVLVDGISHIKHTEGGDFREAVYRALRQGLMKSAGLLLEPFYTFTIRIPEQYTGRVLNDIVKYSGTFQPPAVFSGQTIVEGSGPVASFMNYSGELAVLTGGKGSISLSFSHYGDCHNPEEVISQAQYDPEADPDHPSGSVFCQKGTSFTVNWREAELYMHCLR